MRHIVVDAQSTVTVWQFKDQGARMLGLGPKYIKLFLVATNRLIKDNMHGMTLQQLQLKSGDVVIAERMPVAEELPQVSLKKRGARTTYSVPSDAMKEAVDYMFHFNKNPATGVMDRDEITEYMSRVHKKRILPTDAMIVEWMNRTSTGLIDIGTFRTYFANLLSFPKKVYKHLKVAFVRKDLKKYSEVVEAPLFPPEQMPRYTVSANE